MYQYKSQIVLLDKKKERSFFPENFSNEIYYSRAEASSVFSYKSNFSIKYVINGKETYFIDGKKYSASSGEYLLVNNGRTVETSNDWGVEAISIFLNKNLIKEVYETFKSTEEELLDSKISDSNITPDFFEMNFSDNKDDFGVLLKNLYANIVGTSYENMNISKETYYLIAEKLILSQKNVRKEIGNINSVKKQTREELYKRVLIAKNYLDDMAEPQFNFDLLEKITGLSQFYLIRVFKSVYKVSPYQYYITIKIKNAKKMLLNKNDSITNIAYLCGFNDIFSFSKTFKKFTGITPSEYRNNTIGVFSNL